MRAIGFASAHALAFGGFMPSGTLAAAQQAQEEPREKKICRTTKMTGSLTRRTRTWLTEAQWRELNDRTRRGVDEMVGSASGAPRCISAVDVSCSPEAVTGAAAAVGL